MPGQPPYTYDPNQIFGVTPAAKKFVLFDGTEGLAYRRSTVTIYRTADFPAMGKPFGQQVDALKQLIEQHPQVTPPKIPELPDINGGQLIRANVRYLTLADGGAGVRFVTWYGDPDGGSEALKQNVAYQFRGFSDDGSLYISASLGVDAAVLPDITDKTGGWQVGQENHHAYVSRMQDTLNGLKDEDYTPTLGQLDALVQTISTANG